MCEGSNGCSDSAISNHIAVSAGVQVLQAGMSEPFEPFVCQICLDIAYKPIVLQACGHVFCFWCIRRSMNERKPSQCPACRRAYLHFPRVCRLLHFLLKKAWPLHYQRKASETSAMEQTTAVFSPRNFFPLVTTPSSSLNLSMSPLYSCSSSTLHYDHASSSTAGSNSVERKLHIYPEGSEVAMDAVEKTMASVEDVSCIACRKLLYRPVVINCGEVLCECCWNRQECAEDVASSNECCGCGGVHPRGGPVRVCLPLHHYLERSFSSLYSQRRLDSHLLSTTPTQEGEKEREGEEGMVDEVDGFVHIGVGCDGCGMFPIISRYHYHCVECGEHVGYDLCQSCYDIQANEPAKVSGGSDESSEEVAEDKAATPDVSPTSVLSRAVYSTVGRFDQQHSAEHHMVAMGSAQRARPAIFSAVLRSQAGPLHFDLQSGTISRRRRTHQHVMDDFDDYIDNLV